MTRMRLVIAVGLVVSCGVVAEAQQSISQASVEQRVERLEASLQVVRDYNDDFLSVVLWALTSVLGITVILVSASWFQSNRILRREVEALRAELHSLVETRVSAVETPLREKLAKAMVELGKTISTKAADAAKSAMSPLQDSIQDLSRRIGYLDYTIQEDAVKKWIDKGVLSNACRGAVKMVNIAKSIGNGYFVNEALDYLDKILSGLLAKSSKLEANDANDTQRLLESLAAEHKIARDALLAKLHRVQSL